jgi:hypothetical protein
LLWAAPLIVLTAGARCSGVGMLCGDASSVYLALLDAQFPASRETTLPRRPPPVVLRDMTDTLLSRIYQGEYSPAFADVDNATWADFLNVNAVPVPVTIPDSASHVVLLDDMRFEEIFPRPTQDRWDLFYERFPQSYGLLEVSGVGYNPGRTQALLHYLIVRGPLDGENAFAAFRCVAGRWVMTEHLPMGVL